MNEETAQHIAARIWCDPEMANKEMNAELAQRIAWLLLDEYGNNWDLINQKTPNPYRQDTTVYQRPPYNPLVITGNTITTYFDNPNDNEGDR